MSNSMAINFRASEKSCLPRIIAGTRSDKSKVSSRSVLAVSDAPVDERFVGEKLMGRFTLYHWNTRPIYFFLYSIARAAARSRACVSKRGRGDSPCQKQVWGVRPPSKFLDFWIFENPSANMATDPGAK